MALLSALGATRVREHAERRRKDDVAAAYFICRLKGLVVTAGSDAAAVLPRRSAGSAWPHQRLCKTNFINVHFDYIFTIQNFLFFFAR